jgi:tetratricopeptide (TPR) repeat protein
MDNSGRNKEALPLHAQTVAIYRALPPPGKQGELAAEMNNWGLGCYYLGDMPCAIDKMLEATAIWSKELPADHGNLLTARTNLAALYSRSGMLREGEAQLRQAMAALEAAAKRRRTRRCSSDCPARATELTDNLLAQQRYPEAQVARQRLRDVQGGAEMDEAAVLALAMLALTELANGMPADALAHARTAQARAHAEGAGSRREAFALMTLARAELASGDATAALPTHAKPSSPLFTKVLRARTIARVRVKACWPRPARTPTSAPTPARAARCGHRDPSRKRRRGCRSWPSCASWLTPRPRRPAADRVIRAPCIRFGHAISMVPVQASHAPSASTASRYAIGTPAARAPSLAADHVTASPGPACSAPASAPGPGVLAPRYPRLLRVDRRSRGSRRAPAPLSTTTGGRNPSPALVLRAMRAHRRRAAGPSLCTTQPPGHAAALAGTLTGQALDLPAVGMHGNRSIHAPSSCRRATTMSRTSSSLRSRYT